MVVYTIKHRLFSMKLQANFTTTFLTLQRVSEFSQRKTETETGRCTCLKAGLEMSAREGMSTAVVTTAHASRCCTCTPDTGLQVAEMNQYLPEYNIQTC